MFNAESITSPSKQSEKLGVAMRKTNPFRIQSGQRPATVPTEHQINQRTHMATETLRMVHLAERLKGRESGSSTTWGARSPSMPRSSRRRHRYEPPPAELGSVSFGSEIQRERGLEAVWSRSVVLGPWAFPFMQLRVVWSKQEIFDGIL
jgi:hypothetical protein